MLNTFHVRRRSKEVERQKGATDSARATARTTGRQAGRLARRQGEKLAYANFVIDLSTPARKFNFLPRAMFDTAIQRGPNLASTRRVRRDDFGRHSRTCSGFVNERYLLARASDVRLYPTFIHQLGLAGALQNRVLHRHSTEKKKKHHYLTGYVISPPSHFDEKRMKSREVDGVAPFEAVLSALVERIEWCSRRFHNEFRRASKGARSSAQSSRRRIQSARFEKVRSAGALCGPALAGILLAASAVGARLCEN